MPPTNKRNNIPQALRPLAQVRLNTPAKDYAKVKFLSIWLVFFTYFSVTFKKAC